MSVSRDELSLYEVLEVNANASFEEIDAAHERILAYLGPDSMAVYSMLDEDAAVELRGQVEEAFRTLSDPDRRAAYDRLRRDEDPGYPAVMVPAEPRDASVTMGHVWPEVRSEPERVTPELGDPPETLEELLSEQVQDPQAKEDRTPKAVAAARQRPAASAAPSPAPSPEAPSEDPEAVQPPSATAASQEQAVPAAPAVSPNAEPANDAPTKPPPPVNCPPGLRRIVPNPAVELTADTEFSGALLRRLRESGGASVADVAEITKVGKGHIRAIEENDFDTLPAAVYVRGFVSEYARVLGLDPQHVAQSYMTLYRRYRQGGGS